MSYKKYKKWMKLVAVALVSAMTLTGCGAFSSRESSDTTSAADATADDDSSDTAGDGGASYSGSVEGSTIDPSDQFTDRDLDWSYDASEAETISLADGATTSSDASVVIDGDTITITQEGIYVISGVLSDGQIQVDVEDDDNAKVQLVLDGVQITNDSTACIYVIQADKTFITTAEGTKNSLTVTGDYVAIDDNNIDAVIFSKDDLVLNGDGELTITGNTGHGVVSKDDLKVTGGTVNVTSSDHALSGKDSVRITGATLVLTTNEDGIHSGNSDNADETAGYVYVADGTITITAGDDGMHGDLETRIDGGSITILQSYEGIEGQIVTVTGGTIDVTSSDDGINAGGGADGSGETSGFGGGRDMFSATNENCNIYIYGGTITVNAQGDGLDSNGYLTMTGGTVYVDGPSNDGNGALDFGDGCYGTISGGTILATGMSGMAETFSENSTQVSILLKLDNTVSGEVTVLDGDGNEIVSFTPSKSYNSVVVSDPSLTQGETYTIKTGDTSTEVTADSIATTEGEAGFGGMGGGMRGGFDSGDENGFGDTPPQMQSGEMPQRPDGESGENNGFGGRGGRGPRGDFSQGDDNGAWGAPDGAGDTTENSTDGASGATTL